VSPAPWPASWPHALEVILSGDPVAPKRGGRLCARFAFGRFAPSRLVVLHTQTIPPNPYEKSIGNGPPDRRSLPPPVRPSRGVLRFSDRQIEGSFRDQLKPRGVERFPGVRDDPPPPMRCRKSRLNERAAWSMSSFLAESCGGHCVTGSVEDHRAFDLQSDLSHAYRSASPLAPRSRPGMSFGQRIDRLL